MFDALSPAARPQSRFLTVSIAIHIVAIALLVTIRTSPAIRSLPTRAWRISLIAPKPARPIAPAPRIEPAPREAPLATPAREFHAEIAIPRPAPAKVAIPKIDVPRIEPAPPQILNAAMYATELPHATPRPLKIDNLADTRVADARPAPPAGIVKPAGFAATETIGNVHAHAAVSTNGAFGAAPASDQNPVHRGQSQVGGFSNEPETSVPSQRRATISSAAFGDSAVALNASNPSRKSESVSAATPAEILFKPKPAYTAEARTLRLEGEVLLEVDFGASGEARVVHVVRGLGHGLDESALTAAAGIRFRPATRAGVPVDSSAIVHIVFELAY